MRFLTRLIGRSGIPAFFFFSFVLMLLWNSLVAEHLGCGPTLSYLQTAGLWFLLSFGFAWTGIGARSAFGFRQPGNEHGISGHLGSPIRDRLSSAERTADSDDLGDRIARRVKRRSARWVEANEGVDESGLKERIERKIKRTIRRWIG